MPPQILTEKWEERVRSLLGVDEAYLPDDDLNHPEIIDVAEAEMIGLVPHHAELDDRGKTLFESAIIATCALKIIPSLRARLPTQQSGPHMQATITVSWQQVAEEIFANREIMLDLLGAVEDDGLPTGFWMAGPTR